jgi:hypothetical protein
VQYSTHHPAGFFWCLTVTNKVNSLLAGDELPHTCSKTQQHTHTSVITLLPYTTHPKAQHFVSDAQTQTLPDMAEHYVRLLSSAQAQIVLV